MKPLRDEIIVKKKIMEVETESGILLPDAVPPKQTTGIIIAVGKDAKEVKPFDNVLFGEHAYTEISIEKVDVLFMSESNILAIL